MMLPRRTWLLVAGLLVGFVGAGKAAEPLRVRVLSYNIHHGEGMDQKIDLPRIAAVIQRQAADVVALQEVDCKTARSHGVDQAAELGRLTGMHAAFGKAMEFAGGQYGEAILSRFPLADVQVHPLPFVAKCEPRAAISARIRLHAEGPEFCFVSTHLEHANASLRLTQTEALNAVLRKDTAVPTILAGDFNATPGSPPLKALMEHWTDATADRPEPTWPAEEPRVKIDYVLFRPAFGWRVIEARVVDETIASDHRPLLVVLEWGAGPRPTE